MLILLTILCCATTFSLLCIAMQRIYQLEEQIKTILDYLNELLKTNHELSEIVTLLERNKNEENLK